MDITVTQDELFAVVGELEITRRKLTMNVNDLIKQIGEMSDEITRLREENGRLVQTNPSE